MTSVTLFRTAAESINFFRLHCSEQKVGEQIGEQIASKNQENQHFQQFQAMFQ
jgi:hypothetical protein